MTGEFTVGSADMHSGQPSRHRTIKGAAKQVNFLHNRGYSNIDVAMYSRKLGRALNLTLNEGISNVALEVRLRDEAERRGWRL